MGEEKCSACHHDTAPLYLCRNCGADYLRLVGDPEAFLQAKRPTGRWARMDDLRAGAFRGRRGGGRGRRGRTAATGRARVGGPGRSRADQEAASAGRFARSREPPLQHQAGRLRAAGDAGARADPLPLLRRDGREPQRHHAGEPGHVGCGEGGRRGARRGPGRGEPATGPATTARSGCWSSATAARTPPTRPGSSSSPAATTACAAGW